MSSNDNVLATFKILVIGESGVGKSNLQMRYTNNTFRDEHIRTYGVDFRRKKVNIDGNIVNVSLWDTAGQERFRSVTANYYRNAQAAILVYDVTNKASFEKLQSWVVELNSWTKQKDLIKMVIGNKTDLVYNRAVTKMEGARFANRNRMLFLEASAKNSDGVEVAFEEVVKKVIQTPGLWTTHEFEESQTHHLTDDEPVGQRNKCCGI